MGGGACAHMWAHHAGAYICWGQMLVVVEIERVGGWGGAAIIHAVDLSQRAEKDNWANVPCLVLTRNLHSPKHGLLPPHWNEEGCPTLSENLIYQLKGCKTTKANSKQKKKKQN